MAGDELVARVTNWPRNDPQEGDPGPGWSKPAKDLQDGIRLRVNRVIVDQNNAGQGISVSHVILDYGLAGGCLLGGEAKDPLRIAADNESHPAVAQIADPIEQDKRRSHWITI